MSVIDDVVRSANASAKGTTRLTLVTSSQLRMRLEDSDPVVRLIVEVLLRRYRNERRMHRGEAEEIDTAFMPLSSDGAGHAPTAIEKNDQRDTSCAPAEKPTRLVWAKEGWEVSFDGMEIKL